MHEERCVNLVGQTYVAIGCPLPPRGFFRLLCFASSDFKVWVQQAGNQFRVGRVITYFSSRQSFAT